MRSKMNLHAATGRVANKLVMSSLPRLRPIPPAPLPVSSMPPVTSMPLEWLDAGSWRLPSGKALAEFALQAGFLAPLLLKTGNFAERRRPSDSCRAAVEASTNSQLFEKRIAK